MIDDPVLIRFRRELDAAYGARLERMILYGSRARGDAREDSDYDVAVFIRRPESFHTEAKRLAVIATDILYEREAVINPVHFAAGAYDMRTEFMAEARRDGVDL